MVKINNKPPQKESFSLSQVPKWIWVIVSIFLLMVIIVSCSGGNQKSNAPTKVQQSKDSKQASEQVANTMKLIQQKNTNTALGMLENIKKDPKDVGHNTQDMTKMLTKVFTIYQNVPKKADAYLSVRAKKLEPYFTPSALNQLISKSSIESQKHANIIPQSELYGGGGISVNTVKDVKGAYIITVMYKSFADNLKDSTSQHRDQYIVNTDKNKIISITQVTNTTE